MTGRFLKAIPTPYFHLHASDMNTNSLQLGLTAVETPASDIGSDYLQILDFSGEVWN
jgi:hypothetical protein